jgi:hypothetical protein
MVDLTVTFKCIWVRNASSQRLKALEQVRAIALIEGKDGAWKNFFQSHSLTVRLLLAPLAESSGSVGYAMVVDFSLPCEEEVRQS